MRPDLTSSARIFASEASGVPLARVWIDLSLPPTFSRLRGRHQKILGSSIFTELPDLVAFVSDDAVWGPKSV